MGHIGGFLIKTPAYGYNGIGVTIYDNTATVDNITADGFGTGFWDAVPEEENTVENCIASNYYYAGFEDVAATYCIADGSGPYDYIGGSTDATDLTEDPLYCDRASNEYDLRVDSYGNPENNGSGEIIGAYGVGCMYGTLARTSSFTIDSGTATLRMTGAVTVPQGDTLTLGGHLDVPVTKANPAAKITVNGGFTAVGTSGSSGFMTFHSDEETPAEGDWYGFDVNSDADVYLNHVLVEHAIYGIDAEAPDTLQVLNSKIRVERKHRSSPLRNWVE